EPNGLALLYYLKEQPKEKITLTVATTAGTTLRTLEGSSKPGLNRVVLQLGGFTFQPTADGDSRPGRAVEPREIPPGEYQITLKAGEKQLTQSARVLP